MRCKEPSEVTFQRKVLRKCVFFQKHSQDCYTSMNKTDITLPLKKEEKNPIVTDTTLKWEK